MTMETTVIHKPHAVCIPLPFQSHINAMMQIAKLLHSKGFFITFVNTEFNHRRQLKFRGPDSIKDVNDFLFKTIPDGLDPFDEHVRRDRQVLCTSTKKNCLQPLCDLLNELNDSPELPQVSCIISDGFMSFTLRAAEELSIPLVLCWSISASSLMGFLQLPELMNRGIIPIRDESLLSNGYLDMVIDWIPSMGAICLKDLPSVARVAKPQDFAFAIEETQNSFKASANVINTFDDLEHEVLSALRSMFGRVYAIGSISQHYAQMQNNSLKSIKTNLWKEETECLEWLDKREAGSVVYVNFGSLSVLTTEQFNELAWGLTNSNHPFLWIIRPDAVKDGPVLPEDFMKEIEGRGFLASWCPQEEVLSHPSIGWFLTHCGWNSTLESICGGVPMICCPMFGDQPTNSHYTCNKWGLGIEIGNDVKREEIETAIREVVEGEKGKAMRMKAMEWKDSARNATNPGGSSHSNLDRLIQEVLQVKRN